jgi:glycerol-3-phosphate acyltransferase PlsY
MIGHARPVFLRLLEGREDGRDGGRRRPRARAARAARCLVVWLVVFAAFRYASLASIVTACALPFALPRLRSSVAVVGFAAIAPSGVVALHRPQPAALLAGTSRASRGTA